MDLAGAIEFLLPYAQYGGSTSAGTEEAYDALTWDDERPKPTWAQIEQAYVDLIASIDLAEKSAIETAWRQEQLVAATSQIHCFDDGDMARESGSLLDWRAYRVDVRHWDETNPGYPEQANRPVRPS